MEITFEPNIKQDLVFELFDDETTTEIVYGGGVGGGKSYLLCALLMLKAFQYPGIRIGLARNELSTLKKTTITSFFEVAADWGVGETFQYNSTAGIIKFDNGSEIILVELSYMPSDPKYTRLGGHLFTFGVVDEVGEIDEKGYQIFKTRIGRWKNEKFGIKPITVSTCNPIKNWLYKEWYKKFVDGVLEPHKQFIQALPEDNPFLPESYIRNIENGSREERERLLYGNWEYDDDPNSLLSIDEINNIWSGIPEMLPNAKRYLTADIAFTSDKMVLMIWDEYTIIDIVVNPEGNIEDVINELCIKYKIPQYNVAYDSDGVGKFLTKRLQLAKPIVNNARALKDENYKNLKTQLYYKLVECITNNKIKCKDKTHQEEIVEELEAIRYRPTPTVSKIEMLDKDGVKRLIGRSPDFSDAMAYRMLFEYKTTGGVRTFRI